MQSNRHIVSAFYISDGGIQMLSSDKAFKTSFSTLCLKFILREMS